ncbi:hypothetical protein B0H13DRAFT_1915984 [Mycena leptocephala]|nr:hypothetical protein B0H13DRAFT_1915984 [Mycena leptocephala]
MRDRQQKWGPLTGGIQALHQQRVWGDTCGPACIGDLRGDDWRDATMRITSVLQEWLLQTREKGTPGPHHRGALVVRVRDDHMDWQSGAGGGGSSGGGGDDPGCGSSVCDASRGRRSIQQCIEGAKCALFDGVSDADNRPLRRERRSDIRVDPDVWWREERKGVISAQWQCWRQAAPDQSKHLGCRYASSPLPETYLLDEQILNEDSTKKQCDGPQCCGSTENSIWNTQWIRTEVAIGPAVIGLFQPSLAL